MSSEPRIAVEEDSVLTCPYSDYVVLADDALRALESLEHKLERGETFSPRSFALYTRNTETCD